MNDFTISIIGNKIFFEIINEIKLFSKYQFKHYENLDLCIKEAENQNQIVRLNCKAQAVLESDITDADLENCDGTRLEFWATKKALRQGNPVISLKAFLTKTLGMSGNSFGEMLEQTIGQSFSGIVKHEMVGRNKDILQASVSRILKKG